MWALATLQPIPDVSSGFARERQQQPNEHRRYCQSAKLNAGVNNGVCNPRWHHRGTASSNDWPNKRRSQVAVVRSDDAQWPAKLLIDRAAK
jgi:hypothetical protein